MQRTTLIVLAVTSGISMSAHAQGNLTDLSAAEAAKLIREGKLKSEHLVKALADTIEKKKNLNAFIAFDRETALKAARTADVLAAKKKFKGPLHGVPVVVKDNIHVAGFPNTAGTPALKGFRPKSNAPVAEKLVKAGAIVLGKTNMHELAFGITTNNGEFGPARNPYDPKRIPGGSSGGTGVAIAAHMAPAGLGSDTGGSVRIPAALNGIAGLRPTLKRYPQDGITPIAHTRDTAGPMARTVGDLVLLDSVVTGAKDKVSPAALKGMRIGVHKAYFFKGLDAETEKLTLAALDKMKSAGVQIVEVDMPGLADLNNKVSFPVALYEANVDLAKYLKKFGIPLDVKGVAAQIKSPDVKGVFDGMVVPGAPKAMPPAAYKAALQTRPKLQKLYADTFAKNKIAALAFPTTPLPAAPIGDDEKTKLNGKDVPTFPTFIQNTDPGSNAGIPGLSIPIARTQAGLPIGLELDGPAGSDRKLLAIGLALENVFGHLPAP
ncbi:MAG: indoleacetamide hydrolase [Betaproteobacteria bacterium]|nr:indoleacetamide hydrolase [Betaproteobacteria bacterium]